MKNCWKVLGIGPTGDAKQIQKARRALIRKSHPDTVKDPREKTKLTIRSARINAAYDDALHLAEKIRSASNTPLNRDSSRETSGPAESAASWIPSYTLKLFPVGLAFLGALYLLFFRFTFPLTFLAVIFGAGVLVAGVIDLIVYRFILRPLRSLIDFQARPVIPGSLLELANGIAVVLLFSQRHVAFQLGVLTTVPLWGLLTVKKNWKNHLDVADGQMNS